MKRTLASAALMFLLSATAQAAPNNGENANDLLGQFSSTTVDTTPNYTQKATNNNAAGTNALGFNTPDGIAIDPINHYLFVADSGNNRVMVYALNTDNSISTATGGHTATYILGQTSTTAKAAATTQSGLSDPLGLAVDTSDNLLFVADSGNNRVLAFSTASISTGMNATYELGQPSGTAFTSKTAATSQSGMSDPEDVAYDAVNKRLFVADNSNNRVLIFSTLSISNGTNASNELGQPSGTAFTSSGYNNNQSSFTGPDGLAYDPVNNRIFVADYGNNRVVVFKTVSVTNGMNASYVLGQPDFTSYQKDQGNANGGQNAMGLTQGLSYDAANNRLFVADNWNDRVLVFNVSPSVISNDMNASVMLGQANFMADNTTATQSTLNACNFVQYDPYTGRVMVGDTGYNRVMIFNGSYIPSWSPGYD